MRAHCEDFQQIDIRRIDFQRGALWQYLPPNGIGVSVAGDSVHVMHGGTDCYVVVERTACNYGGSRAWFLCPSCGDRRAVLYDSGCGLGCRRCMRLVHESATEGHLDRSLRKLHTLSARLREFDEKPKWKRWATFEKISQQRAKAERDVVICSIRWMR